jgi:D-alanyl-D-alanine carboxypeptidase/D-alanyl-D-alanine-endopeptidase (penicillin-binding protein 4)
VRVLLLPLLTLPVGFLSVLLGMDNAQPLHTSGIEGRELQVEWQSPWMAGLNPDPELDAILERYLAGLERQGWTRPGQGIWIQAGNSAIAEHQGNQLLSAASLTKLATTLAALKTWPLDHRFETLVGISGTVEDGVLYGDLIVQGNGDPLFVWEEGIVLASELQDLGLRRITGDVLVIGNFTMNFEADANDSVADFGEVLSTDRWTAPVWEAYENLPIPVELPKIVVDGNIRPAPDSMADRVSAWVLRHQSLPLVALVKAMNIYSNNAMAEMMANLVGGPQTVVATVTQAADIPPGEISLINGSGLGVENRMSARAVVALLTTLQTTLSEQGSSVADVLPVAGEDVGTLIDRRIPEQSTVKTGSLAEVSALAGMLPTAEGPVWFAIINRGWAISDLRVQQDQLLQAIQEHWGKASAPPELRTKIHMQTGEYRFGDPARVQPVQTSTESQPPKG